MENAKVVLAIDDNPQQLQTYNLYLQQKYKVLLADSVETSLEFLIKPDKPDIIILDIDMPEINGIEFLDNIKLTINNINSPIIVVSGTDDPNFKENIKKRNVFDVFSKPVSRDTLLNAVERALAGK